VLAPRNVLNRHAAPRTEPDAGDGDRHLLPIPARQQHLLSLLQQRLVLAETALLVPTVHVVLGVPRPKAQEAEVAVVAVLVGAFDLVAASVLHDGDAAAGTLLAETQQPVLIEAVRKESVLFAGQRAQLAAEGVVPLLAAPLKGAEDLPPSLLHHALQQREDGLPAHKVPTWHLGHSLLEGDLILDLAHEVDVGDFSEGDLGLRDDVLEREEAADALLVLNAAPLLLEHHLLGEEGVRDALVDEFLEELAGDGGVDVDVLHLPVGQPQQHERDAGGQRLPLPHRRQHYWLVLLVTHTSVIITMQVQKQKPPVFIIGHQENIHLTVTVLLPA
jgi:hypothetical protein